MPNESGEVGPRLEQLRGETMRTPDEVVAMLRLKALGWGLRRIAREFGCSPETVRRYVAVDGWVAYRQPRRCKRRGGVADLLSERVWRDRGKAGGGGEGPGAGA